MEDGKLPYKLWDEYVIYHKYPVKHIYNYNVIASFLGRVGREQMTIISCNMLEGKIHSKRSIKTTNHDIKYGISKC